MSVQVAPANVASCNHATPQYTPGGLYRDSAGKTYKYVKLADESVTPAAKQVVYWSDTDTSFTDTIVTNDYSECMTDTVNDVRGILLYAATEGYYTFIQTWGYCADVLTNGDDDIAKGDAVIGAGDGTCNSTAGDTAPTNRVLGWAVADDDNDANTVDVFLTIER